MPAASPSPSDAARGEAAAEAQPSSSGGEASGSPTTGFRRVVDSRRGGGVATRSLEGVVHIQNTFNNIHLTLTDNDGLVKASVSAGVVGFRGSRKSQPAAAERAAEELARRALALGYGKVAVQLKGPGNTKQYAVQSLAAGGLVLTSLADVTPIPYNGCRQPKRRRV
ncbi:hypothetical protein GPECTOR_41g715 [Gonium pectorale]|uniref:30S ribosomal protein S11 n=1 Tax=Gonium pectorale TaxID=33097 RepID=A0A150GBL2_GONPE|nr:hypothetical protein GPECTOR_41g715 [Gonium pectorale]|eukprot:KXZ46750.1 hypothetical protein GPECTOR_41g715 [Gonium pectorale]